MPPLKSMERTSSLALGLLLVTACNGRPGDSDDSTTTTITTTTTTDSTDGILDMGVPAQTEWEGILYVGPDVGVYPSRFVVCDTGVELEIAFSPGLAWSGSCDGVFHRFKGTLDETVDPASLLVEEFIEARWCTPDDCGGGCEPDFDSCYQEQEQTKCDPVEGTLPPCSNTSPCKPKRFFATDSPGWMHHVCLSSYGEGTEGSPCEFPVAGEITECVDTCAHCYRCWNSAGTLDTGVCVAYCDMAGLEGPACAGECVHCSSSERGLCMTDCSGDGCRVEEFC